MKFEEFRNEIENIYGKYFPESRCNVKIYRCLGQAIAIDCYLAGKKEELPFGYEINDMFSVSFMAFLPDNFNVEDDLPEITFTSDSHSYKRKSESRYLAYDGASIPYRKTTGSEKFLKAFEKFVKRLHDSVAADIEAGKIADGYIEIVERKVK